jgi:hypothetical protein
VKTFSKSIVAVLVIMILFPSYALGRSVTPMYEDLTGYEFVPGKVDTLTPSLSFNHDAENASDLPDEAEFWTTRTKSSSTTAHVDVTLKGLAAELEFGLETEWGTSTEVSWKATFSIPPWSIYNCKAGSKRSKPTGTENYWVLGRLKSSTSVSGTCTQGTYQSKTLVRYIDH